MKYISQLDGVRAIAVILVIISHWAHKGWMITKIAGIINGVDVFFVLSGFLITSILINNREEAELTLTGKGTMMKSFFMRRALRIFPIYYLVLAILYIFGDDGNNDIRDNIFYFLSYTSNIYFFKIQSWDGILSHLWSLSVEEQFYVVWPWLMLYCKKKHILPIILIFILIGVVFQYVFWHNEFGPLITFSCFDAFGIGALLAYIHIYSPSFIVQKYRLFYTLGILSVCLMVFQHITEIYLISPRTVTSVFMLWVLVEILLKGQRKNFLPNYIFNNPLLVFMGKISYGIYLYHMVIPHFTRSFLTKMNSNLPAGIFYHNNHLLHLENFILLIGISYLSYHFIELRFLSLKKKFEYQKPALAEREKVLVV